MDESRLRPIERRVLALQRAGVRLDEIARRFRRSTAFIERVIRYAELPRGHAGSSHVLRPLERRVLRWRDEGAGYDDIGERFKKTPEFIERVEQLALYKRSSR